MVEKIYNYEPIILISLRPTKDTTGNSASYPEGVNGVKFFNEFYVLTYRPWEVASRKIVI